mmetsp:Transcript_26518/g.60434  ORF Transcript_26518/g.60434 Transcript_26518/m.60434 type:complete len:250 (-) Transcript_26518:457-1206(-)
MMMMMMMMMMWISCIEGSSTLQTTTLVKCCDRAAYGRANVPPGRYCQRLRGGEDEKCEDQEKLELRAKIEEYESLLNADSDAMQQMKEELEAMREFMNSRIEIAISETKELKKQNDDLRRTIADKANKDAVSKLEDHIAQITERHTKEDFQHKLEIKSLNQRISNLDAVLGLSEYYFKKIFRPGEDVVISPEELDELHNVIQEITRVRVESGIVEEDLDDGNTKSVEAVKSRKGPFNVFRKILPWCKNK